MRFSGNAAIMVEVDVSAVSYLRFEPAPGPERRMLGRGCGYMAGTGDIEADVGTGLGYGEGILPMGP